MNQTILTDYPAFIETQFPVSKISKESYKERKANYSQTLTGLGKWWGRKPLIMIRAAILGLLLPATEDPQKDRDIFLKLLTMDDQGLWKRKSKKLTKKELWSLLDESERSSWFTPESTTDNPKFKRKITSGQKDHLQYLAFQRLSYDEKLVYCDRPEHVNGPSAEAWSEINAHLGTNAESLQELTQQLGEKRFGCTPKVGDAFCGGGSVPFEAARLGCEVFGSDLNPVAALLTWAALNILGGGEEVAKQVRQAQDEVYAEVDRQIREWGIEHNEQGHQADAYLYCLETRCPECGFMIPLAPNWVIGEKTKTVAKLVPDFQHKHFQIDIHSNVSKEEMKQAKASGTIVNNKLHCPNPECRQQTPITMIRRDRRNPNGKKIGLRMWKNDDIVPRQEDVFQERLYCIRWTYPIEDFDGNIKIERYYQSPTVSDYIREKNVLELMHDHFFDWQEQGYIPSNKIEIGEKTAEPMRTRGWTYWHHLFNPRQLLMNGMISKSIDAGLSDRHNKVSCLLALGKCLDYNSKLSRWHPHGANEKIEQTFTNQALNTLYDYGSKTLASLSSTFFNKKYYYNINRAGTELAVDARKQTHFSEIWITDPPYADAVNYHELSEFFLAWYEKHLRNIFPDWYVDSKRALAITGTDAIFRKSMVDCYRNLAAHMPDNGLQIVMFTHQDAGVWADLALILWSAGLRVTAAWTIATETDSALKEGNYVQGTVLLVLRKQTGEETAFFDQLFPEVEEAVKSQLDSMLALEDKEDPNFSDPDFQLAAYAAALRVLTRYQNIEDLDIAHELSKSTRVDAQSPVQKIIEDAVNIACNYLIPTGFDDFLWKTLTPYERFYIKGIELEQHREYRAGAYQELAKGFGLRDYAPLLASTKANQVRLKTPTELGSRLLGADGFGNSMLRQILFAIREAGKNEDPVSGRTWLRNEFPGYWDQRKHIVHILHYLSTMKDVSRPWQSDAQTARLLAGAVDNDHV